MTKAAIRSDPSPRSASRPSSTSRTQYLAVRPIPSPQPLRQPSVSPVPAAAAKVPSVSLDDGARQVLAIFEARLQGLMLARLEMGRTLERVAEQETALSDDLKLILALRHEERTAWAEQQREMTRTIAQLHEQLQAHWASGPTVSRPSGPSYPMHAPYTRAGAGSDASDLYGRRRDRRTSAHGAPRSARGVPSSGYGSQASTPERGRRPLASRPLNNARDNRADEQDWLGVTSDDDEEEDDDGGGGGRYAEDGVAYGNGDGYAYERTAAYGAENEGSFNDSYYSEAGSEAPPARQPYARAPPRPGSAAHATTRAGLRYPPESPAARQLQQQPAAAEPRLVRRAMPKRAEPAAAPPPVKPTARLPTSALDAAPLGRAGPGRVQAVPARGRERDTSGERAAVAAPVAWGADAARGRPRGADARAIEEAMVAAALLAHDPAHADADADADTDAAPHGANGSTQRWQERADARADARVHAHADARIEPRADARASARTDARAQPRTDARTEVRADARADTYTVPAVSARAPTAAAPSLSAPLRVSTPAHAQSRPDRRPQPAPIARAEEAALRDEADDDAGEPTDDDAADARASSPLRPPRELEMLTQASRLRVDPAATRRALARGLTHLVVAFDLLGADGCTSEPMRIVAGQARYALRLRGEFVLQVGSSAREAALDALASDDQRRSDVTFTLFATVEGGGVRAMALGRARANLEQIMIERADVHGARLELRGAAEPGAAPSRGSYDDDELARGTVGALTVSLLALGVLQTIDDALDRHGGDAAEAKASERALVVAAATAAASFAPRQSQPQPRAALGRGDTPRFDASALADALDTDSEAASAEDEPHAGGRPRAHTARAPSPPATPPQTRRRGSGGSSSEEEWEGESTPDARAPSQPALGAPTGAEQCALLEAPRAKAQSPGARALAAMKRVLRSPRSSRQLRREPSPPRAAADAASASARAPDAARAKPPSPGARALAAVRKVMRSPRSSRATSRGTSRAPSPEAGARSAEAGLSPVARPSRAPEAAGSPQNGQKRGGWRNIFSAKKAPAVEVAEVEALPIALRTSRGSGGAAAAQPRPSQQWL